MVNPNFHIQPLNRDNYDTWKVQAQAILIKNKVWDYVSGKLKKPEVDDKKLNEWEECDLNARSDLFLIICPTELKQVKNCKTSNEVWSKLEGIYQSKGPARKATLLKRLILHKMNDSDNVKDHLDSFSDTINKLSEMDVEINEDLMSIMLLYSLPASFENFRVAIETRDSLPKPEELKVKILEEHEARRANDSNSNEGALYSKKKFSQKNFNQTNHHKKEDTKRELRCFKCNKPNHTANECRSKIKNYKKEGNFRSPTTFKTEVCLNSNNEIDKNKMRWCLDSGSTSHMCSEKFKFLDLNETYNGSSLIKLASEGKTASIHGIGKIVLNHDMGVSNLTKTLHVPELSTNLLSISKVTDNGYDVLFQKDKAQILTRNGEVILEANRENDLYFVKTKEESTKLTKSNENNNMMSWHKKLAHMNENDMKIAQRNDILQGLSFDKNESVKDCETCIKGKMSRLPFPKREEQRTTEVLEIIHSDVFGPVKVPSHNGAKYFVTFTDDYSRYCRVYFLKQKNEVFEHFKEFQHEVERSTGKKIKALQTDNEVSEYCNKEFNNYLKSYGIKRRLTVAYTPQQNPISERKNRTLIEKTRCLLIEANLPNSFWAEAVNTANYLINRSPCKSINGETPFQRWVGRMPSVRHLHIFGAKAFVLNKKRRGKLDTKTDVGIFVGYSEISKAYRIWIPKQRQVVISRDVKVVDKMYFSSEEENITEEKESDKNFIEMNFDIPNDNNTEVILNEEPIDEEDLNENVDEHIQQNQNENIQENEVREQRNRKVPEWTKVYDMSMLTMDEALKSVNAQEWSTAIKNEIKSHLKNKTWIIADKKEGKHIITSKIILTNKYNKHGEIERRKARIVARGFNQIPGIEYNETYSPVVKLSSLRFLIGLAVEENFKLHQMDVNTAFLNGDLEEEIYMEKPEGIERFLQEIMMEEIENEDQTMYNLAREMLDDMRKSSNRKVCQLKKSLYGLKQAGRQWFMKLDKKLIDFGFTASLADPCVYVQGSGGDRVILTVYVDDIIIASPKLKKISEIKKKLTESFEMRDLGTLHYCLGIEFEHKDGEIFVSQRKYTEDLLKKFGMMECNPTVTPLQPGIKLSMDKNQETINVPYQNLIGSLMYLAIGTRPDISHAVSYLSQYNSCYKHEHWLAAKRVVRYLKETKSLSLRFRKTNKPLEGMADADWASSEHDRRSYTGYCFKYGGSVISWESRKQKTVALSTAEAEFMSLTEAAKEAIHLKKLSEDLGKSFGKITLYNDNQSAKNIAENAIVSSKSKHISIKEHFIREKVSRGELKIEYKPTKEMEADLLTKPLPGPQLTYLRSLIGLT